MVVSPEVVGKRWYQEPWPWILMAGPILVIIAGAITTYLAIASSDGLVADDYYKQGLAVNQVIERDRRAVELGLQADVMIAQQKLRVFLVGGSGLPATSKLNLRWMRPTRAGEDMNVELKPEGPGLYSGTLNKEISGRWVVSLEDAEGRWRLGGAWRPEDGGALRLTAAVAKSFNRQSAEGD